MKTKIAMLKIPAIISSLLLLPLVIMELINQPSSRLNFPLPLFGMLWLLPVMFMVVLQPMLNQIKRGQVSQIHPVGFILSLAALILLASMWFGILLDQLPCFLGVPNCD